MPAPAAPDPDLLLKARDRGDDRGLAASDPSGPIDAAKLRNLFPEINDRKPASTTMELPKVDRSAAAGNACHDILDQLVLSDSLQAMLDPASLEGGR